MPYIEVFLFPTVEARLRERCRKLADVHDLPSQQIEAVILAGLDALDDAEQGAAQFAAPAAQACR